MKKNPTLVCTCPNCNEEIDVDVPDLTPNVRSKIKPVGTIQVYRITSEEIKEFLFQKARFYKPGAKMEVATFYCENKTKEQQRGYAFFRIGFSNDFIETKSQRGWFEKAGENSSNINFVEDILKEFIQRYQFSKKSLQELLGSYKNLEKLENRFGIRDDFIEDIMKYIIPQRVPTPNNESWIIFSARAEEIIRNMLEDEFTNAVGGELEIHEVHQVNKGLVEFIIYIHPKEMKSRENPYVRKILVGGNNIEKK